MKALREGGEEYLGILKERGKKSHVYRDYQLVGLQLAEILNDLKHKSLYIKLAKTHNQGKLIQIAKTVAEKSGVNNPGAYFMKVLQGEKRK